MYLSETYDTLYPLINMKVSTTILVFMSKYANFVREQYLFLQVFLFRMLFLIHISYFK